MWLEGPSSWALHESPTLSSLSQLSCGHVRSSPPSSAPPLEPREQLGGNEPTGCKPNGGPALQRETTTTTCHAGGPQCLPTATVARGREDVGEWLKEVSRARGREVEVKVTEAAVSWAHRQNLLPQARKGSLAWGEGFSHTTQGRLAPRVTMRYCGFFCPGQGP